MLIFDRRLRQSIRDGDDSSCFISKLVNCSDTERCHATVLHEAAISGAYECAKILLKTSADVQSMTTEGMTPLHEAARCGSLEVAKLLVESGADSFALNNAGYSPVMIACRQSHFDMVKFLSSGVSLQKHLNLFKSNLAIVTVSGRITDNQPKIWDFMLAEGISPYQLDTFGCSAVHFAMTHPSQTCLRLFLRRLIDVFEINKISWDGEPLNRILVWARGRSIAAKLIKIAESYHLISRCLGDQCTPIYSKSITTGTDSLLYRVASLGLVEALDNFLVIGIGLEWECCDQGTVLMIASANGRLEAVKYLVRKGAQLQYTVNGNERSAISAAHGHREVIDWLLIGRFSDQHKLAASAMRGDAPIRAWTGVTSIPIPLKWEWRQMRDESLLEYARRSQTIRKQLMSDV